MHVPRDVGAWGRGESVVWDDLDPTLEDGTVRSAWYGLTLLPTAVGYRYVSKRQGDMTVRLAAIGGLPVPSLRSPTIMGNECLWENVVPDLDVFLRCSGDRVECFKRLKGPLAPKEFTWEVEESEPRVLLLKVLTAGMDNADLSNPARIGTGPGRLRRALEMEHLQSEIARVNGRRRWRIVERWTGRTLERDPEDPTKKIIREDALYPVLIDQDVSESIADVNDDGHQTGTTTWNQQYGATGDHIIDSGLNLRPGYRFQTVAIPAGATIDDATFTVNIPNLFGAATTGTLFGNDVDDAPAWANNAGPNNMTTTAASLSWVVPDATGDFASSVTTIIQEIVNRAGWASGNDLALGVNGTLSGSYKYINDLNGGATGIATLVVNYTSGAAANTQKLAPLLAHRRFLFVP